MANLNSPRLNIIDRLTRRLSTSLRREIGEMERGQVRAEKIAQSAERLYSYISQQIAEELTTAYPKDGLTIDGQVLRQVSDDGLDWWVSPLGSKLNFTRGLPGIYMAFACQKDGEITEGALYRPTDDTLVQARKGDGAFSPAMRLRVSDRTVLDGSVVFFAPGDQSKTEPALTRSLERGLSDGSFVCRMTGAPLLDMLAVASGQADGFIGANLAPVEVQLGALLIKEAGGTVTDLKGQPVTPTTTAMVAANNRNHTRLLKLIAGKE